MNRDGYRLVQQGLATMVRIAQSDDLGRAQSAAEWLVNYGESVIREKRVTKVEVQARQLNERESILHELRGLYAKALGPTPAIVETVAEPVEDDKPQS